MRMRPEFLDLGTMDIWDQMIIVGADLCLVGCLATFLASMHYIPVAHNCSHRVMTTKSLSRYYQLYRWGEITPG